VAGLVLWSTTLLSETSWTPLLPRLSDVPVLMSHGTLDPLLPFSASERLRALLSSAGARVTWVPFRGQHEIPMDAIEGANAVIAEALA
jgi:phospholipase/carboxylesterase